MQQLSEQDLEQVTGGTVIGTLTMGPLAAAVAELARRMAAPTQE